MQAGSSERVVALFLVALGGLYVVASFGIAPSVIDDPMGPRWFPQLAGTTLMVTAGLAFLQTLSSTRSVDRRDAGAPEPRQQMVPVLMAMCGAYLLLLPRVGFAVSTAVMGAVTLRWVFRQGWRLSLAYPVALTLAVYVFFQGLFGVQLP